MSDSPGVLYIVATPIGNLGDITYRAIEVLGSVDLIAAEDTRHSKKLLIHYGINVPMMALHEHNERERSNEIISVLASGRHVALISDAGTPLISDPGYPLVARAREAGIRVVPVPGPSAVIAALSVAGLPTDRFCFEGFLSARAATRDRQLAALQRETRTLVFYEAPHRLLDSLHAMRKSFGPLRQMVLMRELTKLYETIRSGSCDELIHWVTQEPMQQKGECVLVVAGAEAVPAASQQDNDALLGLLLEKLSVKDAVQLAVKLTGQGKNELYQRALQLTKAQT